MKQHTQLKLQGNSSSEIISAAGISLDQIEKKLRTLSDYIELLGAPMTTLPGIGLILIGCLGIGSFAYHHISLYVFCRFSSCTRPDHLSFLFSPRDERRRVCNLLDDIVRDLANTNLSTQITHCKLKSEPMCRKKNSPLVRLHHRRPCDLTETAKTDARSEKYAFIDCVRRLVRDRNKADGSDIEWPYSVSADWHHKFTRIYYFLTYATVFVATRFYLFFFVSILTYELISMAQVRHFRYHEPTRQHVDFHLDPYRLKPLTSLADELAYMEQDEPLAIKGLLKLVLTVEIKYYFSLSRVLFIMELLSWGLYVTYLAALVGGFIMCTVVYQLGWLNQLLNQLVELVKKSRYYRCNSALLKDPSIGRFHFPEELIKVYLNFELFRRQSRPCHLILNLLLPQVAIFSIACLLFTYLIAIDIDLSKRNLVLLACSCVMISANCCLIFCGYRTKMILGIMRTLSSLVAQTSSKELTRGRFGFQMIKPVDLWRRQLLDDSESTRFYASNLLGYHVTLENVISINAYFLAIWLVMVRLSSQ